VTDAENKRVALDHLPAIYELVKDLHIIADRQASHGFLFTPSILRAAASRLSEMDAEIKRLRDAMRLIANRPTNIPMDPHGMAQFARAALEHQP
jgi:hypothetical protein